MRRIMSVLMASAVAISSHAQGVEQPELAYVIEASTAGAETGINMYPTVVTDYLNIDVSDEMAGGKVTVSVFSSMGEIVLKNTLGLGLNKLDVEDLRAGKYTAVVRKNGEYKSKMQFEVARK